MNTRTKTINIAGRTFHLPTILPFQGRGDHYYTVVAFRPPRAREFFVSGAKPTAYEAYNDMHGEYLVVTPTAKA